MQQHTHTTDQTYGVSNTYKNESCKSGVNWAAVLGGAFAAISVTLILLTLGSGLGFATNSPWDNYSTASATKFSATVAIFLLVTQWLASALGGYLTGRLRTKWVGIHTDEVFFRDTANGFLSWAVASVITMAVAATIAGGAIKTGATASALSDAHGKRGTDASDYYVDTLYRSTGVTASAQDDSNLRSETKTILAKGMGKDLPDADRDYLARRVVARTGVTMDEARDRVNEMLNKAKHDADEARKAAARIALFTALAMVVGAFIASAAAALGGIHRDDLETVHLQTQTTDYRA